MRAFHWLLVASLLVATPIATAANGQTTQDQRVGEGLMLMLKGDKPNAWKVLFPEAKAGNVIAMYHLGMMMAKSPEYPDHLERSKQFFSEAARRGHRGSEAMLAQVERMLSQAGKPPSIAGSSGTPLPQELEAAKQAYAEAKAKIGRFVGDLPTSPPQVTIKAFITENAPSMKSLIAAAQQVQARFGDKVDFQFYVVIDQSSWDPRKVFTPELSSMPITGFRPDMNGQEASRYGVRNMPAIVFIPENGNPRILASAQDVITQISSVLR